MEARATTRTWAAFARPAGRFGLEFAEMCVAMCAGGGMLSWAVFAAAAALGYPALAQGSTGLAMLIIGFDWAIAMGAWMAIRGHAWRHNLEMSGTSVLVALAFALASGAGLLQVATPLGWFSLFTVMCGPACVAMALDMLLRYRHYTEGRSAHAH